MNIVKTALPDVLVIQPEIFSDQRGYFLETYHSEKYRQAGIPAVFVQDNRSLSQKNTLRGLHAQLVHPQGKLIQVIDGEIFDVAVDVRRGSPTYKKWVGVRLSAAKFEQCYVPPGFVHGFCVLSDKATVEYKCTDIYDPSGAIDILWNDPDIGIEWPIGTPILSKKDAKAKYLKDWEHRLPTYASLSPSEKMSNGKNG